MTRRLASVLATLAAILAALAVTPSVVAGGGCHDTGAVPSDASSSVVRLDGCTFLPTVNRVPLDVEVTFLNTSQAPHDVTGRSGTWRSRTLQPGQSFATTFTERGIYPYSCSLHPGMAGVIVAGAGEGAQDDPGPPAEVMAVASPDAAPDDAAAPTSTVLAGAVGLVLGSLGMGALIAARRRSD